MNDEHNNEGRITPTSSVNNTLIQLLQNDSLSNTEINALQNIILQRPGNTKTTLDDPNTATQTNEHTIPNQSLPSFDRPNHSQHSNLSNSRQTEIINSTDVEKAPQNPPILSTKPDVDLQREDDETSEWTTGWGTDSNPNDTSFGEQINNVSSIDETEMNDNEENRYEPDFSRQSYYYPDEYPQTSTPKQVKDDMQFFQKSN